MPLILPEPDAGRRPQFDQWFAQSYDQLPCVALEVGGWLSILSDNQSGIGVGFVSEQAVQSFEQNQHGHLPFTASISVKMLGEKPFISDELRVFARKQQGHDTPDLGSFAFQVYELLKEFASTHGTKR